MVEGVKKSGAKVALRWPHFIKSSHPFEQPFLLRRSRHRFYLLLQFKAFTRLCPHDAMQHNAEANEQVVRGTFDLLPNWQHFTGNEGIDTPLDGTP